MKKILFYIVVLIFSLQFTLYAQSGIINYSIKSIDFVADNKKGKYNDFANELRDKAKTQDFALEFNSKISKFSLIADMKSDESEKNKIINKMAAVRFTSNYSHYNQKKDNLSIYLLEDGTLIKTASNQWKITSESKKIDNYLCYKATLEKKYIGRDGTLKTITIIAWFAPALPYSYGPKGYNGLPGLIIELQEKETTYLATKVKLLKKETKILWPKGKMISEEEYIEKIK